MVKSAWQRYLNWWKTASFLECWAVLSVGIATLLGAVYRLVDLRETLQFLADQGRDVITAYGILHGDIALVGPSTSVGDMFLGPIYYYFMAPWLALAGNDPVGPALAVAVIGIFTIPVLYWVGKQMVGPGPALMATLLFAVSPVAIEYTRFSWNPNPAPLVMLLLLWGVWKAWNSSARWWLLVAASWAILIQLHYVALLSILPAGIFWLADVWRAVKNKDGQRQKSIGVWTLLGVVGVIASWLPLVAFDFRFNHQISKGFMDFLDGDAVTTSPTVLQSLSRVVREQHGRAMHVLFEIWGGKDWTPWYRQINTWLLGGYAVVLSFAAGRWWKTRFQSGFVLLLVTLLTSVLGLAWYKGVVFNHYITYLLPVSYLLTGVVVVEIAKRLSWVGIALSTVYLAYILWLSVLPSTLMYLKPLGWTVDDYQATAELIQNTIPPEATYGLANLSEVRDYRGLSYRYFLLTMDHPPVDFAEQSQADYLVVIAESPREPEDVLVSPVYEISVYPKGEYHTVDISDGPRVFFIQRGEETAASEESM